MKSFFRLAFVNSCISVLLLNAGVSCFAEDLFPDKSLEAAVRSQVYAKRKSSAPLTEDDVKNVSEVRAVGKGIKSLEGLQYCKSLQLLDLRENKVSSLLPLKDLTRLQSVRLADNKIESLDPIAGLDRVQLLDLSGNAVKDLSSLAKMTNLRTLYLSGNPISEIDVLEALPKMTSLHLDDTKVASIEMLAKLSWLSTLTIAKTQVSRVDALKSLRQLRNLDLSETPVSDLSPLVVMAEGDEEGRFASFWKIHLAGTPAVERLTEASKKAIDRLQSLGVRLILD